MRDDYCCLRSVSLAKKSSHIMILNMKIFIKKFMKNILYFIFLKNKLKLKSFTLIYIL